jgi:hypothetical protein
MLKLQPINDVKSNDLILVMNEEQNIISVDKIKDVSNSIISCVSQWDNSKTLTHHNIDAYKNNSLFKIQDDSFSMLYNDEVLNDCFLIINRTNVLSALMKYNQNTHIVFLMKKALVETTRTNINARIMFINFANQYYSILNRLSYNNETCISLNEIETIQSKFSDLIDNDCFLN